MTSFVMVADCGIDTSASSPLHHHIMEAASLRRTPNCKYDAYRRITDYADKVLAVYDPATARGDAVHRAIEYAKEAI